MESWEEKPTVLVNWEEDVDYVLAIDENGISNLKGIIDATEDSLQWFTITGVLFNRNSFSQLRDDVTKLKCKYWKNGLFKNKRIVFHSRDIRKKVGPFNPKLIQYNSFRDDLKNLIKKSDYTIFSSSIDKFAHIRQYVSPFPVYDLCLEFILERFSYVLNDQNKTGVIVMEARGPNEDKKLLFRSIKLLKDGNKYHDPKDFQRIQGIYFNPKRTKGKKLSFPQLEIADLISYYIYNSIKLGEKTKEFIDIEKSLYNYPNYIGFGLKVFPKKMTFRSELYGTS